MRKTKIICTLGPSTDDVQVLRELMYAGMDVARFNFSHGTHESHKATFEKLAALRDSLNLPIATLLDTKGPEIRIGTIQGNGVELVPDQTFTLTTREVDGDANIASINYKELPQDLEVGRTVLIDDGLVALKVIQLTATDIVCKVLNRGVISTHKGVNVPGTNLTMPYISERDRSDIIFGIECGFDFIAASFVRSADDILEIRKILDEHNCHTINIVAKIENLQGVENIDEIIRVSDGIMVARGDMGVEVPLEDVPVIQKMIIHKVYTAGKQVITATQMLDSMIKNPRPTRAEATDVANAIYDGTSAIMLSGETAAGLYPVEAVKTMARIARRAERDINYAERFKATSGELLNPDVTNAISHATCTTALDIGASAIITVTKSGATARMISKYRPSCPIIGCSPYPHVCRQLNLSWGVVPLLLEEKQVTEELFSHAVDEAERTGLVSQGQLVVITAGVPLGISGTTNMMKVQVVGHILISGQGIVNKSICASLCVCKTEAEALSRFTPGSILVIPETTNNLLPLMKKAAGIITETGGLNSHAAIVGLSLDIPVIIGAANATSILKSGAVVNMDSDRGVVSACSNDDDPSRCEGIGCLVNQQG